MVEERENANHVVVGDGLLERLQESLQSAVSHREVVDLAAEDEFVVDSADGCGLEGMMREKREGTVGS